MHKLVDKPYMRRNELASVISDQDKRLLVEIDDEINYVLGGESSFKPMFPDVKPLSAKMSTIHKRRAKSKQVAQMHV